MIISLLWLYHRILHILIVYVIIHTNLNNEVFIGTEIYWGEHAGIMILDTISEIYSYWYTQIKPNLNTLKAFVFVFEYILNR